MISRVNDVFIDEINTYAFLVIRYSLGGMRRHMSEVDALLESGIVTYFCNILYIHRRSNIYTIHRSRNEIL